MVVLPGQQMKSNSRSEIDIPNVKRKDQKRFSPFLSQKSPKSVMRHPGRSQDALRRESPLWVMVIQIILLIESGFEMIQMH